MTDERCLRMAVVMALMRCLDSYFISPSRTVLLFGLLFFLVGSFFTLIKLHAAVLYRNALHGASNKITQRWRGYLVCALMRRTASREVFWGFC